MRKFVYRFIIIVLLLIGLDALFGLIIKKAEEPLISQAANGYNALYSIEKMNADVCIIGGSTASRHINPKVLQDSLHTTVYNSGEAGCYLYYQALLTRLILKYNPHTPKYILWVLEDSYLSGQVSVEEESQHLMEFYRYYDDADSKFFINQNTNPIFMYSNMYRYNNRLYDIVHGHTSKKNNAKALGYMPIPTSDNQVKRNNDDFKNSIDSTKVKILEDCVKFVQSKGVKLIFATTPRYDSGKRYNSAQYKLIGEIAQRYHIPYYDAKDCTLLSNRPDCYYDFFHFNAAGAELYSKYLVEKIKNLSF